MRTGVLVLGESLIDVVRRPGEEPVEHVGGSAANAAIALARLGQMVRFATALGKDARGKRIEKLIKSEGISWAADPHSLDHTSVAFADIDAAGAATYTFDLSWVLNELGPGPEPVAIQVSSLAPVLDPGCDAVIALVERFRAEAFVSYDINLRPSITGTGPEVIAKVESMAALADLVKASDEDLSSLYPELDEAGAASRLRGLGAQAVVVTRGPDGVAWYGDAFVELPAPPTEVVDTIGAGDTFGAALLDELLTSGAAAWIDELDESEVRGLLTWAARAAAINVARAGANPPHRREMR